MYEIVFDRIEVDGRTTAMIKNIPNKYSLAGLADEIDITHSGQYDFLYLPFDYTVTLGVFRANAIWATPLLTSFQPKV